MHRMHARILRCEAQQALSLSRWRVWVVHRCSSWTSSSDDFVYASIPSAAVAVWIDGDVDKSVNSIVYDDGNRPKLGL